MGEQAEDREDAEAQALQAADHGYTYELCDLASKRERAGDQAGAVTLCQQAADRGDTHAL